MNEGRDDMIDTGERRSPSEEAHDLRIAASVALNACPAWAGDVAGIASEVAATVPVPVHADAAAVAERRFAVVECPLHTAMRHLTEAAVAQHVLYLEGEVRSRPDLITAIERWDRMHALIRECVCPATREVALGADAVAEIVDASIDGLFAPGQQQFRTQFVRALAACSACASAAECPLGSELEIG